MSDVWTAKCCNAQVTLGKLALVQYWPFTQVSPTLSLELESVFMWIANRRTLNTYAPSPLPGVGCAPLARLAGSQQTGMWKVYSAAGGSYGLSSSSQKKHFSRWQPAWSSEECCLGHEQGGVISVGQSPALNFPCHCALGQHATARGSGVRAMIWTFCEKVNTVLWN